jgi:hypothetical protein|tara:strand:+ start:2735 stop:3298 length:564 start_codon:yes stop_codon:yes gene_type:complete
MGTIRDFKYKKIKKFLTKKEVELLTIYSIIKHRANSDSFDTPLGLSNNLDTMYYGDAVMESVMLGKQNVIEKETGLKLLPTYAFWRMYTYAANLPKHRDRSACEISVTVMLGSDGTEWPISMNGVKVNLKPGDAVVYLGCEVKHGREDFKGDWQSQLFMHYVDKNGKYTEWEGDKRSIYGTTKRTRK